MDRMYISAVLLRQCHDNSYIDDLPVVRSLLKMKELAFTSPVTFLVGENGTGKSTLLEAIAVKAGYNGEGGSKNFCFSTRNTVSNLAEHLTVARERFEQDGFFLRAESFYNLASEVDALELDPGGYGGRSLHAQSHGESFLSLVQYRFRGRGLYLLDEPEAALSPTRQLTLLAELHRLVGEDSQFIIATHSPLLLACPGALIYQITEHAIEAVAYEDCEHYQLTKRFLNDPQRMLTYLLEQ